jgi:enoyl-CoA hydratase/carnithine racemase
MAYINIALSPDGGASWSLSQALPRQLVGELLLGGERMTARRLHELGVVNRVTPGGGALDEAMVLAEKLNAKAPNAVASMKELINDAAGTTLNQHLAAERDHLVRNLHHANAGIGIAAFLARQTPDYQ